MTEKNLTFGHDLSDIGKAGLFLKASSSLVGPAQGVTLRFPERRTDHEIELVAVIGKAATAVSPDRALDHVAGYCLGLDMTLRGPEDRSFRKSPDSYAVLGPWLTTADEVADPQALRLRLWNGDALCQDSSTSDIFYTLEPGDLLYTGTPAGVGQVKAGDTLFAECAELGAMSVAVHAPS
jgi:2-keto-4-pentenoate hydratase/2-oxohepta-3-ene-1,7-dioic acid hydratase in catechol pathway